MEQGRESRGSGNAYSTPERKLIRITQDLPFNPPPAHQLEDKINQMRLKIARHTTEQERKQTPLLNTNATSEHKLHPIDRKESANKQDNGSQLPRPRHRLQTETPPQYNQVASLLTERLSKASLLNRTNEHKPTLPPPPLQYYREERISRDKDKNPLKYKIIKEEVGIRNDARVYELKQDQVDRIQEQFMRRKGLEYLREGNIAAKEFEGTRFYSNTKGTKGRTPPLRHANSGTKIHQIFGNPISRSKAAKSDKSLKPKKRQLEALRQQEEMLGKIVFQKVKKHLREEKEDSNFFRRVHTEETIDDALVDFLRVKIERAEASLK